MLQPANILLDRVSNKVTIIDFGLASMAGISSRGMPSSDLECSHVGSPAWFSPEMQVADQLMKGSSKNSASEELKGLASKLCRPEFEKSPALDIWATGIVMVQLMSGVLLLKVTETTACLLA